MFIFDLAERIYSVLTFISPDLAERFLYLFEDFGRRHDLWLPSDEIGDEGWAAEHFRDNQSVD